MDGRKRISTGSRRRVTSESGWTSADVFIFDVEGTLVDAMMPTLRCWRETLEIFGYNVGLADLHRLAGMDGEEMLATLLPGTTKNERQDIVERQGARFREDYLPGIPPFPGVRPLFEELKRQHRQIALATDCQKDELSHYLAVANIETMIDAFACGNDVKRGKPASGVVDVALRRIKAGRKRAALIGDTPFDAKAARKAGVMPVGVLTGHFSEHALREAGCRAVLRDPCALHGVFLRAVAPETEGETAVA